MFTQSGVGGTSCRLYAAWTFVMAVHVFAGGAASPARYRASNSVTAASMSRTSERDCVRHDPVVRVDSRRIEHLAVDTSPVPAAVKDGVRARARRPPRVATTAGVKVRAQAGRRRRSHVADVVTSTAPDPAVTTRRRSSVQTSSASQLRHRVPSRAAKQVQRCSPIGLPRFPAAALRV